MRKRGSTFVWRVGGSGQAVSDIMDTSSEYDFLVIGGGSAGYAAARTAVEHGLRTAVIDGADELGGLCILRGCMPSKTLIESANRFRSMRRAPEFGLRAGQLEVRPEEIIARKRLLIGDFAGYRQGQLEDGRFTLIRGHAAFTGLHEVEVTPREGGSPFRAGFRSACIASGSVVMRIPVEGLEETGYWISDDVLEAESLPDSFVVLGGGAIAVELACYLEGLGKTVTVIQRSDHVLSSGDPDVGETLGKAMNARENCTVHTGTSLVRVEATESGRKRVWFTNRDSGEAIPVEADEIVQALGRVPRTGGLNLDAAGVRLVENGRHITCDRAMRTSCGHIFAAGDVCGPYEIVHVAIEQGEVAAGNAARQLGAAKGAIREMDYRLNLFGVFSDPEVGTVGLSEKAAAAEGRPVVVASYPFDDHGKSMVMGETEGFVKLVADEESRELVGGAVVGPHAVELIHEIVVALHFRATAEEFLRIPHYHPTLSEIWTYPAEELLI